MKKIYALLLITVILAGCSAKSAAPREISTANEAAYDYQEKKSYDAGYAYSNSAGVMAGGAVTEVYGTPSGAMPTPAPVASPAATNEVERKIIKTASITAETFDFDNSADMLLDTVLANGGYVEQADVSVYRTEADYSLKRGHYTIRVPQENFDAALEEIEKIGKVLSTSLGGSDVTSQYYDIESRLAIKKEEEKRVFEMIAKAEKIEDLINLESRLSEIRTDIELYQTRLNSIDRLSSFSTINVSITQVKEYTVAKIADDSFLERLKTSFKASINFVIVFFQTVIIIIAGSLVPAAIVAVIVLISLFIYRKMRKTKKEEDDNENE